MFNFTHLRRCAVCGTFHLFYNMFTIGKVHKLNVCKKCHDKAKEEEQND